MNRFALSKGSQGFLTLLSLIIVAFGQPAWSSFFGLIAAAIGYALFWRVLLCYPERKHRFWFATLWFALIQVVQLSWVTAHPYLYIYVIYLGLAFGLGVQFGLIGMLIHPQKITKFSRIMVITAIWTLLEWSRLFVMSGYSWNPIGLALAGNIFALQIASIAGVFGLSFLVMFTNFLALRAWSLNFARNTCLLWLGVALAPYLLGGAFYTYHEKQLEESSIFPAVLVQTSFPVEVALCSKSHDELVNYVIDEWKQILTVTKKHKDKKVNLIALPEFVVPFGTYTFVYPYEKVEKVFQEVFGPESLQAFPSLKLPLAYPTETENGQQWKVSNAFFVQSLANIVESGVIIGLADAEDVDGERKYFTSAIYIEPESQRTTSNTVSRRYAKRILVPMGEYIPFTFCKNLAAQYGVFGSFTPGEKAEVWQCNNIPIGLSICYEETFGDLMRENKNKGAEMLLNLTSDAWFPYSQLIRQHLEHARLRTVENGIPMIRSCNTGITCGVDSLGRDVAVLGDDDRTREDISDALYVELPTYHYQTLYSWFGDGLIVGFSLLVVLLFFRLGSETK